MSVVITAKGFYVEANAHFRFWPLADNLTASAFVRFWTKADIAVCRSEFPFSCRLSRALPVGHAFSDKFSLVSCRNVLLPCLCDALLTILPTQRRSAQGWRSGYCCLSHDVSSEQNQREKNQ
jgi:hypothetical protein